MVMRKFDAQYDPTIEDSYRKHMMIDGESCIIEVLDMAGCEEYHQMQESAIQQAEGFIIVYNITSQPSFQRAQEIQQEIQQAKNFAAMGPVVLAGNMTDLKDRREVTKEAGLSQAAELGFHFEEVCAKTCSDAQNLFNHVVRRLRGQVQASLAKPCDGEQPPFLPPWIMAMHKIRGMFRWVCF